MATLGVCFLATVGAFLGPVQPAQAALAPRHATIDRGNFVLFGNTTGLDCRDTITEKPVVGTVPTGPLGLFNCRGLLPDASAGDDVLWRSDEPKNGQALASPLITPAAARSTAVLSLPPGAKVTYARLYWAAQVIPLLGGGGQVVVERPGTFVKPVGADAARGSSTFLLALLSYYQSTADITALVQQYGSGAYRISGIDTVSLISEQVNTAFIGWSMVVFYSLATDPPRNLALYDGFDRVAASSGTTQTSLSIPNYSASTGAATAQLGILAYGGNSDITGDQLLVNNSAISNTYNPANNFFNRTSTVLGALGPQTGDLPQMSGRPGSLSGMDIDVVDISSATTTATSLAVVANTTADEYFVGAVTTSVAAKQPVFTTSVKTVTNVTRLDGRFLPGDTLQYTITATNTGTDSGTKVVVKDLIPAGTTYVAGSIQIASGTNLITKTDKADTDEAEYVVDAVNKTNTVVARLGTGADGTTGGTLNAGESASVRFQVKINDATTGTISNQGVISSVGTTAGGQGGSSTDTPTGNGQNPGAPTTITVTTCNTNADCTPLAPICDTTVNPHQCVCNKNSDCANNYVCSPMTNQCVECLPGSLGNCNGGTIGAICLPNLTCGCTSNADCNGRTCNTTTGMCAPLATDLGLALTRTPAGTTVAPGTALTYNLVVTNKGATPIVGAEIDTTISPNQAATWTCTGSGGAQCPSASGSGPVPILSTLPAGGALTFTYTTTASSDPASSAMDFTATVIPPRGYADTNPADNTVTDSVLIGMTGPDLSLDVTEMKSPSDPSVTYTYTVTNHGPGDAPGATITYQVPDNATVDLTGGAGWTCTQKASLVTCVSTQPITNGEATSVQLVVHPTGNQTMIPLKASVTGTDQAGNPLVDPDPSNNSVDRSTDLNRFKLSGGGLSFGCTMATANPPAGLVEVEAAAGLLLLFGLLLASRRRRAVA